MSIEQVLEIILWCNLLLTWILSFIIGHIIYNTIKSQLEYFVAGYNTAVENVNEMAGKNYKQATDKKKL